MAIKLQGYVFKNDGTALSGATVQVYDTSDSSTEGTAVTTDSDGLWTYDDISTDALYDVKISSGGSVRWRMGEDKIQIKEAYIRNDTGATQGGLVVANATNSASNKIATFANLSRTGADNDEIYLSFEMLNDADVVHEFARMTVVAKDVSNSGNTEDGEIQFDVMKSGTLTKVWTISSSTAGATSMDMDVDAFTIGTGTAATDITLTFDAESADGVITWMEDEDYFKFSDDILMNSTERINFYDTAIYIYSSTDGQLDLVADTEIQIAATTIDINGAVALDGAITGATNINR